MKHNQRARLSAQVMKNLEEDAMLSLRGVSFEDEDIQRYLSSRLTVEQGVAFEKGDGLKTPHLYLLELLLGRYSFPMEDVKINELFIALLNVTSALAGYDNLLAPSVMQLKIASEFYAVVWNQTSLHYVPNYPHIFDLLREVYQFVTSLYIKREVDVLEQQLKASEEEE